MSDPTPLWQDPVWLAAVQSAQEEEAFIELQARLDRADDYAPAGVLGGAVPFSRPTVAPLLAVKDGDSPGELKDARISSSSAVGCSVPRPLTWSSPSASGVLLLPARSLFGKDAA